MSTSSKEEQEMSGNVSTQREKYHRMLDHLIDQFERRDSDADITILRLFQSAPTDTGSSELSVEAIVTGDGDVNLACDVEYRTDSILRHYDGSVIEHCNYETPSPEQYEGRHVEVKLGFPLDCPDWRFGVVTKVHKQQGTAFVRIMAVTYIIPLKYLEIVHDDKPVASDLVVLEMLINNVYREAGVTPLSPYDVRAYVYNLLAETDADCICEVVSNIVERERPLKQFADGVTIFTRFRNKPTDQQIEEYVMMGFVYNEDNNTFCDDDTYEVFTFEQIRDFAMRLERAFDIRRPQQAELCDFVD